MADVGRESEIRYLGEIDSSPAAVERIIGKLAGRYSMPIHTRPRLAGIGDLSITRRGTDGFHDSPLEGRGFELPVPLARSRCLRRSGNFGVGVPGRHRLLWQQT